MRAYETCLTAYGGSSMVLVVAVLPNRSPHPVRHHDFDILILAERGASFLISGNAKRPIVQVTKKEGLHLLIWPKKDPISCLMAGLLLVCPWHMHLDNSFYGEHFWRRKKIQG